MIDVILPVLDEADALPWVLGRMPPGFAPLVVDNGSQDGSAELAAATTGQTICLANGDYGDWTGTNKNVTVKASNQYGAVMTIRLNTGDGGFTLDGLQFNGANEILGSAANITVRNSRFSGSPSNDVDGHLMIDGPCGPLLFERNTFGPTYSPNATHWDTSRINMPYGCPGKSGTVIRHNLFVGGNSDGIQTAAGADLISNEMRDICSSSLSENHVDFMQLNGATQSVVRGNYLQLRECGDEQTISGWDGVDRVLIEDNVIESSRRCIALYSDDNSVVRHNTCYTSNPSSTPGGSGGLVCAFNIACGSHEYDAKNGSSPWPSGNDPGVGTEVYDNIVYGFSVNESRATLERNDHNLMRNSCIFFSCSGGLPGQTPNVAPNLFGVPAYEGDSNANDAEGLNPVTWLGWRLAAGSPGENAASDGKDVGVRFDEVPLPGL